MTDDDLVSQTLKEAQRLSADSVGPNPFRSEQAISLLREVLNSKQRQKTNKGQPDPQMAGLDRDRAIHLRWTLRDIKGKRTKLSPVSPEDLRALIEMGFVDIRDDFPVLTDAGRLAIE